VIAIQDWLRTFRYTLELPATAREATLENFLFRRRAGHCEYFSTALAMLLREVGVPARNVNGFLGGTWNDFGQYLTVTMNEAHSWVEVYFPRYGWVPFDATPAASTDLAKQQSAFFAPLRRVFDGLEHRWNKWILEYNIDTQVNLFKRATQPFARPTPEGGVKWNPNVTRTFKLLMLFGTILVILISVFRRARAPSASPEARTYLKLRRAYEKAGYDVKPYEAPMQFVKTLQKENAPGHEHARRVVEIYLRSRFSGADISDAERSQLKEEARLAFSEGIRRAG
jgi:hypothetical protein